MYNFAEGTVPHNDSTVYRINSSVVYMVFVSGRHKYTGRGFKLKYKAYPYLLPQSEYIVLSQLHNTISRSSVTLKLNIYRNVSFKHNYLGTCISISIFVTANLLLNIVKKILFKMLYKFYKHKSRANIYYMF